MDLYIQFRHTRPEHSSSVIGEVISIYETSEIVEPPAGHLSWVKVEGLHVSQGKIKMQELLAGTIRPEESYYDVNGEEQPRSDYDPRQKAVFDFASLPDPFLKDFLANREVTIPFGIAVSLLHNRKLNRTMTQGDFD